MASTFSTRLRLEKQANGENDATWGTKLDTVIELTDEAIAGWVSVTHDDAASYTLTASNSVADEARNMILHIVGTLTAARNVVCPTQEKLYFIKNATTGGFAVTLKTTAGTGISVPNGKVMVLYCDGTNVVDGVTHLSSLTLATPLAVAQGGTGTITGFVDAGTRMLFQQTAAPTGFTKVVTHNDKAMRVVSGAAGSGGATAFTSVFGAAKTAGGTALSIAQTPSHAHTGTTGGHSADHSHSGTTGGQSADHTHLIAGPNAPTNGGDVGGSGAGSASGGSSNDHAHAFTTGGVSANHTHGFTSDATGGGISHDHTLSLDLQYVDCIIATKD